MSGGGTGTDRLSPAARRLCDAMAAFFPGPGDAAALRAAAAASPRGGAEVASVRDADADGVPVRIYDPAPGAGGRPLAVFFHGGGWVMCGLDTHDALCRALAVASGAVVVSADYRLAPEHPWPAAPDDALTVLLWARARAAALGCDPARLIVAGDSSGGTLAAVTALRAPELVAGQLLFYPALDASMEHPSVAEFAEGYFHTAAHMAWYWDQYGGDPDHPHVSPLRAPTSRGCRARCWCWPTATSCATRAWPTGAGWAKPEWTAGSSWSPASSTASSACRCRRRPRRSGRRGRGWRRRPRRRKGVRTRVSPA